MAAFMASSSSSSGAAAASGGGGIRILDEAEVKARRSWVSPALDGDGEDEEGFGFAEAAALARARDCDVYLGHGGGARRVVAWLRAELELLGVPCVASDRRRCGDAPSHAAARAAMEAAAAGVVVVTPASLGNPYAVEEARFFADRGALVPVLVGLGRGDLVAADVIGRYGDVWEEHGGQLWKLYDGTESEWREAVEGLAGAEPAVLFGDGGDVRDRVLDVLEALGARLGRRAVTAAVKAWRGGGDAAGEPELPFPRSAEFVGREEELAEVGAMLRRGPTTSAYGKALGKRTAAPPSLDELVAAAVAGDQGPFVTGVVCISGASGAGKTELALEFAHRHAREYKRVLWVRGEPRYLRQSYLALADHLGVAVGDDVVSPGNDISRRSTRSLTDIEGDAIAKVRKELARDIPYLVVIDNVESARDWWDGRAVQELLPRAGSGGATHVVITTRLAAGSLPGVRTLELGRLAAADAMRLMKGTRAFGSADDDAAELRSVEEDVGGAALGLALVGAVLSELDVVGPAELRRAMRDAPHRAAAWADRDDPALRDNPGLARLLDASLALLDREASGLGAAVARLLEASSFFAPAPIPVAVLARAAACCSRSGGASNDKPLWKRLVRSLHLTCASSPSPDAGHAELEALVRLGFARRCAKPGHVAVHNVFRLFGRKIGSGHAGRPVVRAVAAHVSGAGAGDEHIWAACLSTFKFEAPAAAVELPATDLARFVTRHALPLAARAVAGHSAYGAALELLREATDAVRRVENMYGESSASASSPRRGGTGGSSSRRVNLDPSAYEDVARARAELLMARARIMARAGENGIAEDHCLAAIDILEVVSGDAHPDTQAARAFLEQAVRPPPDHSSSDLGVGGEDY